MFNKNRENDNQNFWISYADLMAGLLFVFILLIGAIVIKYVFMQGDLLAIKTDLQKQEKSLKLSEKELAKKREAVAVVTNKLIAAKEEILHLSTVQAKLQNELDTIKQDRNITADALNAARVLLAEQAKDINETKIAIDLKINEITQLKSLLLETEESLSAETNKTKILSNELSQATNLVQIKDGELALLAEKLLERTSAHQKLIEDLNITKSRIKNLTGIRIKVIQTLKEKLGNSISVDPNNGAIRLPSSVLFDKGSSVLKDGAKKRLQDTLFKYIDILLGDEKIKEYVDSIVIEGYTDSDGPYLYNLQLSQQRALAVLDFIYSQNSQNKELLQKYVSASGRSFSNLIFKDGKEDQDASRRIEIKFSISNKKAIQEIETFLQGQYN